METHNCTEEINENSKPIVITQEIKEFLRDNKYVNICMYPDCIKKCLDEFCREHGKHKCAWPSCNQLILNKKKEFCGHHTPEAREKNSQRIKNARFNAKKVKEIQHLLDTGVLVRVPQPGDINQYIIN